LHFVSYAVQTGAETNKRSGSSKENSGIIRENNRHPKEIGGYGEENNISGEKAIGDGKESNGEVNA
jgi:hypothetical protein